MTINVPEASLQDIFDFVAAHLMTQGVVSEDQSGQCVYRSPRWPQMRHRLPHP